MKKQSYEDIDALYEQIMGGRSPAGSVSDRFNPNIVTITPATGPEPTIEEELGVKSAGSYQSDPVTVIEGEAVQPIEYPDGYKPRLKQSEIIRQNYNEAIKSRMRDAGDLEKNIQGLSGESNAGKARMRQVLENIRSSGSSTYTPNAEIEDRIKSVEKSRGNLPDYPERDLTTEMILGFGPALLGLAGGNTGQLVAKQSGTEARNLYETKRKETIERIKEQRKGLDATYKELLSLKAKDRESWDKSQQRELDRMKAILGAEKELTSMSLQDLQKQELILNDINKGILDKTTSGALEVAKMEKPQVFRPAAPKAAKPPELPLDKKKIVEKLATSNASKIAIKNQIDAVVEKWDNLSDDQKLAAGRQLLKTLNSTEGADAIGVEEANRLGAKLEFAMGNLTNSNSFQDGRDLKGFKQQAAETSKSIGTAIDSNGKIINNLMGGGSVPSFGSQSQGAQQPPSAGKDAKIQGYADQNKLTYDQALKILEKRGYREQK